MDKWPWYKFNDGMSDDVEPGGNLKAKFSEIDKENMSIIGHWQTSRAVAKGCDQIDKVRLEKQ